jgi:hypothetical protein
MVSADFPLILHQFGQASRSSWSVLNKFMTPGQNSGSMLTAPR